LIVLLYFDWVGSVTELKELNEKIKTVCDQGGVRYLGLYGPMNQKWNYVWMFDARTYEEFGNAARQVHRHVKMPHHIAEILIPQDI